MKTIIAGSRSITCPLVVPRAVRDSGFQITEVVCGMAKGADTLGQIWGIQNEIPICYFKPNWELHGRSAGFIRNQEMADYADALLAIWDGQSRGTKDMIDRAQKKGLKVFIYNTSTPPLYGADLD